MPKDGIPWEYIELILCRDIYHCTPLELKKQPKYVIDMHLALMDLEGKIKKFVNK